MTIIFSRRRLARDKDYYWIDPSFFDLKIDVLRLQHTGKNAQFTTLIRPDTSTSLHLNEILLVLVHTH